MDFNLSKKRARSHSIEAEEPPNKKLCASGPGPKISGMISSSHPELSMAENQVRMNIIAEEHRIAEQGTTVSRTVFRIVKANMAFDRYFGR